MENEVDISPKIKLWIIVGVVVLVTFIIVFFITNKMVNGNKKKESTEGKEEVEKYDSYKVGDIVNLKDDTIWYVLYESEENVEYITLLSKDNVNNTNVLYGNVNSFLKGTFKNSLVSELKCESSDIQEVRLLAYLDLATLANANSAEFLPETELSKFNIPEFIYVNETVTDTVYKTDDYNKPVMICREDGNGKTNRFCLGDSTTSLPVRPVLTISKKFVTLNKDDEKEEKVEEENKEETEEKK